MIVLQFRTIFYRSPANAPSFGLDKVVIQGWKKIRSESWRSTSATPSHRKMRHCLPDPVESCALLSRPIIPLALVESFVAVRCPLRIRT